MLTSASPDVFMCLNFSVQVLCLAIRSFMRVVWSSDGKRGPVCTQNIDCAYRFLWFLV